MWAEEREQLKGCKVDDILDFLNVKRDPITRVAKIFQFNLDRKRAFYDFLKLHKCTKNDLTPG